MTDTKNAFLPEGYEAPASNANYMKLLDGENKIRILSKPIVGWLDWKDKKPLRFRMNAKPEKPVDPAKPIKHFWAFLVWNYAESHVQVLELTQATIQKAIADLSKDDDWGPPFGYDIKITRKGKDHRHGTPQRKDSAAAAGYGRGLPHLNHWQMKIDRKFLLPAGKVESEQDMDRQLGIERDKIADKIAWLALVCGLLLGLLLSMVAGLTYHHWKHLIF